jgi:hypothetical protein
LGFFKNPILTSPNPHQPCGLVDFPFYLRFSGRYALAAIAIGAMPMAQ